MNKGTYQIIRTTGTEELIQKKPDIDGLYKALGIKAYDTITLTWRNGIPDTVMVIDDTGMIDSRPINEKATKLVRQHLQGFPYAIHGDVAIVNDNDFEREQEDQTWTEK